MNAVGPNGELQMVPVKWPYYPLLVPSANHPITRNLNRVKSEFVNSIDTVGLDSSIRKTILLSSSPRSRISTPPFIVSLSDAGTPQQSVDYSRGMVPAAVLLEGSFQSVFKGRMIAGVTDGKAVKEQSEPTKMVVVADGDIIRNEVSYASGRPVPQMLGKDRYTDQIFGNRDFILNCMNYLVDDNGLMELRSRELKLSLINKPLAKRNLLLIRLVNILLPVMLIALTGIIYGFIRQKSFAAHKVE
jgi:ABC-2 type transport system permease protein